MSMSNPQRPVRPLRTNDYLRTQIIRAVCQIDSEPILRRIAQQVSQEWIAEQGGELILKEAFANGR